ncbi:MAG: hypothetical protein WEA10_03540 [Actinomycetota bacterium]
MRTPPGVDTQPVPPDTLERRSNRGFWVIAGALALAGVAIAIGTIVSRPEPPSASAQTNLRVAVDAARIVEEEQGSLAEADAGELQVVELTLDFVPGDEASTRPTQISVDARSDRWLGVALGADGRCAFLGVVATGEAELSGLGPAERNRPCTAESYATLADPTGA